MHRNATQDNAIALIIHHCYESTSVALLHAAATEQRDWLGRSLKPGPVLQRVGPPNCQYTLRRTAPPRGATPAPAAGRTTGRATTAAPTVAPPPATQPARTTPRAQTTALASMVLKATKLPASNRGTIRCLMAALLGVLIY